MAPKLETLAKLYLEGEFVVSLNVYSQDLRKIRLKFLFLHVLCGSLPQAALRLRFLVMCA